MPQVDFLGCFYNLQIAYGYLLITLQAPANTIDLNKLEGIKYRRGTLELARTGAMEETIKLNIRLTIKLAIRNLRVLVTEENSLAHTRKEYHLSRLGTKISQ